MKRKILIGGFVVIALLCIIASFVISYLNIINKYETKIEELTEDKAELLEDNFELAEEIKDLSENIYNVFEKQPYKISIEHDGQYITYQQEKFGWFDSYTKSTNIF